MISKNVPHTYIANSLRYFGCLMSEECPDPFDPSGWEVLTTLKDFFENPDWHRVVDSVLLWNVPVQKYWPIWKYEKQALKMLGFQAYPNTGLYAQDITESKWIVYFDRLQHLDYLEEVENE